MAACVRCSLQQRERGREKTPLCRKRSRRFRLTGRGTAGFVNVGFCVHAAPSFLMPPSKSDKVTDGLPFGGHIFRADFRTGKVQER